MKKLLILSPLLALFSCTSSRVEQATVKSLDLNQYQGEWHEIGRLPNRFEKDLIAAKATYSLRTTGDLRVENNGKKANGKTTNIIGTATQPDPSDPGKLKVRFNPFPANLFAGDYWILAVTPDYRQALIGSPKQNFLWFLSKDATDQKNNFEDLIKKADALGYPTAEVYWNPARVGAE